jgi:hypothetical protein
MNLSDNFVTYKLKMYRPIVDPVTPTRMTIHGFRSNVTIRNTIAVHARGEMMGMRSITSADRKTARYIMAD